MHRSIWRNTVALAIGVCLAAAASGAARAGCTITVNTSAYNRIHDAFMSLDEAESLTSGVFTTCFTVAEKAAISGATWALSTPQPSCPTTPTDVRWDVVTGCGDGFADDIVFSDAVSTIFPTQTFAGTEPVSIVLRANDDIDGRKPNGSRVTLAGPGRNGTAGTAIFVYASNAGNQFRNLIIRDFNGNGIYMTDPDGAVLEGLDIYNNSGHGIRLGDGVGNDLPLNSRIGGTEPQQVNYLFDNGGNGILLDGGGANSPQGMGNSIQNCLIGLDTEAGIGDHGNGLAGIALSNVSGTVIGGLGANQRNAIGWNDGPGIRLVGPGTNGTLLEGNLIGLAPTFFTARPNLIGVLLAQGAHDNVVGTGNTITGSVGAGVLVDGEDSDANVVRGNRIGLSPIDLAIPNGGGGLLVSGGADATLVGGNGSGDRNVISGNTGFGVRVSGASTASAIRNNAIGTASDGATDRGNGDDGIHIDGGAGGGAIERNLVSGNGGDGIELVASGGNVLRGNGVGVNGAISGAVRNDGSGIVLSGSGANVIGGPLFGEFNVIGGNGGNGVVIVGGNSNVVLNNLVGSAFPLGNAGGGVVLAAGTTDNDVAGNLIAGNGGPGVDLANAGTSNNRIRNNAIGLDQAGTGATPNAIGVRVYGGASNNTIGGSAVGDRNTISGNNGPGVGLYNPTTTGNVVLGNRIGTNVAGTAAVPNAMQGVVIQEASHDNSLSQNLISGNSGDGVLIRNASTFGNRVQRNVIGMNAAGTAALGNAGAGVHVADSAGGNFIGSVPGFGNTIRFNGGDGIWIESGFDNGFPYNLIADNAGLGADLGANGVTPNDGPGDPDGGANQLLNYPTITQLTRGGGMVSMVFTLSSNASSSFTIEAFYAVDCDASGHGEGFGPLGAVPAATGAGGTGAANAMFPLADSVAANAFSLLAHLGDNSSEFSACAAVAAPPDLVFANGFDNSGATAAPDRVDKRRGEVRAGTRLQPSADGAQQLTLGLVNDGADVRPAREITIGATAGVLVENLAADGAACELAGAILCAVPELGPGATAEIRLSVRPGTPGTALWLESRDASGAYARELVPLDVPR